MRDRNDLVTGLEDLALFSRASRLDLSDGGISIFTGEHGPDTHERKGHRHVESFFLAGAKIVGVRVVRMGQRIKVPLQHFLGLELLQIPHHPVVPAVERLHDFVVAITLKIALEVTAQIGRAFKLS